MNEKILESLNQMKYLIGGLHQNMNIDNKAYELLKKENENNIDVAKNLGLDESVIAKLTEEQYYFVSFFVSLNNELVKENIITPTQRNQASNYMLKNMKNEK